MGTETITTMISQPVHDATANGVPNVKPGRRPLRVRALPFAFRGVRDPDDRLDVSRRRRVAVHPAAVCRMAGTLTLTPAARASPARTRNHGRPSRRPES